VLRHHPAAHTDGDLSVRFETANIVHTGDIYWNGMFPFIDYSTGGSIDGMIRGVKAILSISDKDTIIIPGHGQPHSNLDELQEYLGMLKHVRSKVAQLKAEGRQLADIIEARPTQVFDAAWGKSIITPEL